MLAEKPTEELESGVPANDGGMSPSSSQSHPMGHRLQSIPLCRGALWLAILLAECWVISYQLRAGRLLGVPDGFWLDVAAQVPMIMGILVVTLAATLTFGWSGIRAELTRRLQPSRRSAVAWPYLLAHVFAFASYVFLTARLLQGDTFPLGPVLWAGAGVGSFGLFGLAFLPARAWVQLGRRLWVVCLVGLGVGILAFFGGQLTVSWWGPLSDATFWLVRLLLSLVVPEVVSEPAQFLIGTPTYQVIIGPPCSGYEGIGLFWVFLAAYLWLGGRSLRFPQAFVLFPIGTLLMWLTNGLRITALILIGDNWSWEVAERGFHSQAGWLAFNAVGLGLVAVSSRWSFLARSDAAAGRAERTNPAAPYLVPFVVLMAALMICAALSAGFDYLYPVRFLAVAAALWWYRREYARWSWTWSWPAVGIGILVFVIWLALENISTGAPDDSVIPHALAALPAGLAGLWLICRVLGSVVTVPLAEELAFRGFLIRRLQGSEFEEVPTGRFSWMSFVVSSLLFGLLHDRWLAGTCAGMFYALALCRRGRVADAVWAHATTNALIAAYVVGGGAWSLWS